MLETVDVPVMDSLIYPIRLLNCRLVGSASVLIATIRLVIGAYEFSMYACTSGTMKL